MPYQQFMSAFAQDVLHVGARMFGLLTSCVAIGALVGATFLAARRASIGLERVIPVATLVFGAGLVLFSLSRVWWTAMPLLVVVGLRDDGCRWFPATRCCRRSATMTSAAG